MHDEILRKHPSSALKVYAIWFDMLAGDSRQLLDTRILADPRVTNFWDQGKVVGRWYSDRLGRGGVTWDAYFLYGPAARWDDAPSQLISASDAAVIGSTDQLTTAIRQFL